VAVRDRFDDEARRASARADDEARRLGHRAVGTEHLLLGLLGEAGGAVAQALTGAGATFEGARHKVAEAVGSGPPVHDGGELTLTARARRALDRASRFSLQARAERIGADHVLLGVLDVEGTAGQVLRGLGVDVAALRKAVDRPAGADPPASAPAEPAAPRREPCCPLCGVALAGALTTTYVPARDGSGGSRDVLVAYCGSCGSALGLPP
jgi:ATP-dependent Clp protease ATP-binding subunit ClpA